MKLSIESLECLLAFLLLRFEKLERLLHKVENDIAVLKQLISEMKQAQAPVASQSSDEITRPPKARRVIEALDVHTFLHRASNFLDYLQGHFHIHIKYAWFCQFICLRYSLKRQRGGIPGSDLSPTTILSYFKKERAGEY